MKVLILSDASSIHTQRWVFSLLRRGCEITLFNLLSHDLSMYKGVPNLKVVSCDIRVDEKKATSQRLMDKFVYIKALSLLKKTIRDTRPDFVHAHYVCSYGLLGALAGYHPYVLSVWGSDVYDYPYHGKVYDKLLRFALGRADYILSTSNCMARQTSLFTPKPISVTPFGVDMRLFAPVNDGRQRGEFVVGNVKALKECYGIDTLIQAFALADRQRPDVPKRLVIVGEGPDEAALKELCGTLGIEDKVDFSGYIANKELPAVYSSFDVAVSLSREESFGVVAVEAMSCECPVVTSDADGFCEVVEDGVTGYIVPRNDPQSAAEAIIRLMDNPDKRAEMGRAGRKRVAALYDWERNVDGMMEIYHRVISSK